ncbi:SAM-dependent methyltransferase [Aquimarina sp. EL_43]|uniref:SAM-dependent methyltransferase n=1 Tax=Aquimarina sp. EL_43 TaxID=2787736 RepID=UPI0020C57487|nr:SAM-dependent methyltransferase [Aquimarina sp. EL_43]
MHTIYGIALGPGDPELLTLKALRILKEVDLIFYPGSITKDQKKSFVYPILQYHGLEHKELKGFFLNMSYDRQEASETYAATVKDIEKAYQAGKKNSDCMRRRY